MSLTAAAAAAKILAETLSLSKTVREQAKGSKDTGLKALISDLYDSVLSVKEAVMLVTDENIDLRRRIAELERPPEKPAIRQVGLTHYYFEGTQGPFCQPCYDVKGKLIPLAPQNRYAGGIGRKCEVCNKVFFETNEEAQLSVEPFGGPDGWML
jgi:hypothetical protein